MRVNFQKNLLDLHITFEVIAKVKFQVIMTIGRIYFSTLTRDVSYSMARNDL